MRIQQSRRSGVGLLLTAALLSGVPVAAQAVPLTFASTTIGSKFSDNETYVDSETSDTGQAVSAEFSHYAGQSHTGGGDQGSGAAPGLASGSASADLAGAQIKVRSQSEIRTIAPGNIVSAVSSVVSAGFGDHLTTTAADDSPFDWTSGGVGRFDLRLDGDLIKMNQDGDTILQFGIASWTVRLVATAPDGTRGVCDWREGVGGFDLTPPPNNQPYRQFFAVSSEGTSNDCDSSGSLEGGNLRLSAGINLGADFDWILSLAASTRISDFVDVLDVNLGDTLDVSYTGPEGTTTIASVFGGIEQGSSPPDPDPAAVPEPESMLLFGLALAGLAASRRTARRRRV